jgi:GNAT superfamily N-acetyltransferase
MSTLWTLDVHDDHPGDATGIVDRGLGSSNDAAAPLHEVRLLSCFARDAAGTVIGGAVGRRWGGCCELQQLWVAPERRRQGLGAELVRAFEARARSHGCTTSYLETFDFQAPHLYESLGYRKTHAHAVYPHGIVRFTMVKVLGTARPEASMRGDDGA